MGPTTDCHGVTSRITYIMPVQLRARRTRPSYRDVLELPEDDGPPLPEDDASSESDFELAQPKDGQGRADDEDPVHDTEEDKAFIQDNESDIVLAPPKFKGKEKGKGNGKGGAAATVRTPAMPSLHRSAPAILAPGLSRPNARQSYALPLPSLNHRHRGTPVYLPALQTRRLVNKPSMFSNSETVLTRSIADPVIRGRVNKANGHNVGRGPVWELLEDLSWFKESPPGDHSKPVVYDTLRVGKGWELLSLEYVFARLVYFYFSRG
jgi:transcription factor C subunit 6